uniref:Uncharacterized protein n=1 Tax=Plectus sambesii TaxID=2011161 RepID=A0A914WQM9_9BILA
MKTAPAVLDATKQQKCDSLMSTWSANNDDKEDFMKLFKRQATTGGVRKNRKQGRKNRRLQRKRERMERRRNNPVRLCFVEAKKVKKRCQKLSHCCTVAEDCRLSYQTSPLHDQIETAKHTARQSRRKCKEARDAAKKARKDAMQQPESSD